MEEKEIRELVAKIVVKEISQITSSIEVYVWIGTGAFVLLMGWLSWVTIRNIAQAKDIAVNTAQDALIMEQVTEKMTDLKEDIKDLEGDIKDLILKIDTIKSAQTEFFLKMLSQKK